MRQKLTPKILVVIAGVALVLAGATVGKAAMVHRVSLAPTPLAKNAGLQAATGVALVDVDNGSVKITVTLATGTKLPAGAVLEGGLSMLGGRVGRG